MQKLKFFIGIIAIMLLAIGFSSCEKDADFQGSDKSPIEYSATNNCTASQVDTAENVINHDRGMMSWYIYPTWHAVGLNDNATFSVSGATKVIINATKDTESTANPVIKYSWDNFATYGLLYLDSSPGVTVSQTFTGSEIESNTLYLKQLYAGTNIGTLKSYVTVSYKY